ncbi:hypothetical protein AVEN_261754-1 [Araneus ventricosus]|uniref:Uncharacterized protein n=1 Tax=Araneus ventricosus TaxID=182803 RepID=A0A4Y2UGZ2_ARAVE|nr:hypothetical protein AVEN_261754-1 [Araneus ventricosus]
MKIEKDPCLTISQQSFASMSSIMNRTDPRKGHQDINQRHSRKNPFERCADYLHLTPSRVESLAEFRGIHDVHHPQAPWWHPFRQIQRNIRVSRIMPDHPRIAQT